ncbi:PRC-barrel domain-containing protein [Methanococcus maripaludis]|uniref:Sporulation protein YlmC with PRC-barrel domain n=2 Tax=Methanococcus maripaludis TaxID=39152 RepID=A0A7J9PGL0_METMI|nr:PRC-barrel domain-containing protein [Methanococcus maripaludis]MBA2861934.1 sporulation protein YlmC with PRC-barrel domain [Methanococcus maripaludis]
MKLSFKSLNGRSIVGSLGSIIGTVDDIVIDEKTGRIISLNIEPSEQSPISPSSENYSFVPYRTVTAIRDVVVIDETKINAKA